MDSIPTASTSRQNTSAAAASAAAATAAAPQPNSTELMIALSQIQQLIPLLDYRPGGLTHLLPTLLTPLLPHTDAAPPAETMQRYRANVDHAFRVAAELVARISDPSTVGSALHLAQRLMNHTDHNTRLLRVRNKRRLYTEHQKLVHVNNWAPQIPPRSTINPPHSDTHPHTPPIHNNLDLTSLLASQNPHNIQLTPAQLRVQPPKSAQSLQSYLVALSAYLNSALENNLVPVGVDLNHVHARIVSFTLDGFELQLRIPRAVNVLIEAIPVFADQQRDVVSRVDVATLTIGGVNESISATTSSAFPIFRTLSSDILLQTNHTISTPSTSHTNPIWSAYNPITETITRVILACTQFQT